jgi:hypothetical protein
MSFLVIATEERVLREATSTVATGPATAAAISLPLSGAAGASGSAAMAGKENAMQMAEARRVLFIMSLSLETLGELQTTRSVTSRYDGGMTGG